MASSSEDNEVGDKGKRYFIWTSTMDMVLSKAFIGQLEEGNRVDGKFAWKPAAWKAAIKALKNELGVTITKANIQSRLKTWQKHYDIVSKMLCQSGFSWDFMKGRVNVASESVWNEYLKAHPDAAPYRSRIIIDNWKDIYQLFTQDPANDEGAQDPANGKGAQDRAIVKGAQDRVNGKGAHDRANGKGAHDRANAKAAQDRAIVKGAQDRANGKGAQDQTNGKVAQERAMGKYARTAADAEIVPAAEPETEMELNVKSPNLEETLGSSERDGLGLEDDGMHLLMGESNQGKSNASSSSISRSKKKRKRSGSEGAVHDVLSRIADSLDRFLKSEAPKATTQMVLEELYKIKGLDKTMLVKAVDAFMNDQRRFEILVGLPIELKKHYVLVQLGVF